MNSDVDSSQNICPIREAFRKFKQKQTPLNSKEIIDVDEGRTHGLVELPTGDCIEGAVVPRVFTSREKPGLHLIRHALNSAEQRRIFEQCLLNFPRLCLPEHSNVQVEGEKLQRAIWSAFEEATSPSGSNHRDAKSAIGADKAEILQKLRWLSMGVHYDWTSKLYEKPSATTRQLPTELKQIYNQILKQCHLDHGSRTNVVNSSGNRDSEAIASGIGGHSWSPDTAIVNLYHPGDTIGIHDDHSEECDAPLVSVSLGLPALLLVGTTSLADPDVHCFLLRSGDCVVLSGPQRLAFHAVPRVVSLDSAHDLLNVTDSDIFSDSQESRFDGIDPHCLQAFIRRTRINISVRQVYSSS